jgi:transcriptional regulator with XRE-family HTH domain
MSTQDYGQFIQQLRKSRGLTQQQIAVQAGVSESTVRNLEASSDQISIRSNNLDAILTVYAQRAALGPAEIKIIAEATNRRYESIESLNDRANQLKTAELRSPASPLAHEPTTEERINHAIQQLLAAGAGDIVLAQLEALVGVYSQQIADAERTPSRQRFQVVHPMREVNGKRMQDISHYEVPDEQEPGQRTPSEERSSNSSDGTDVGSA